MFNPRKPVGTTSASRPLHCAQRAASAAVLQMAEIRFLLSAASGKRRLHQGEVPQALLLGLGFIRPLFIADQTNSVKPYLNSAQYRLLIMMAGAE
ncbi:hypothetical protein ACQV2C_18395 [Pantoea allii]|uniref:hypothetical protein n=1 Tax=Pantoea allii TaxID=574096 RepID=UPI003D31D311